MNNVRWESPFPYTLAFNLFKQHFEEINRSYWAFVPVANTIKSIAKKNLTNDDSDPKTFFLIPDEEDRRIAPSYGQWKEDFSEFTNYTRLNTVMLISSCFETYLRTVISLSFESKPGVIISCPDAVDGASLLKQDIMYGDITNKAYRFMDQIDEVCVGEWTSKRFVSMQKYFGTLPKQLLDMATELDGLRVTRNNIGHYLGRKKSEYEAPIDFKPTKSIEVSHIRIQKYFKLVYSAAKLIDEYLHKNIIGSYDIIKKYFIALSKGEIINDQIHSDSYQLRKMMGSHDLKIVGKAYYNELVNYCDTNYVENNTDCIFTRSRCVQEINRRLREANVQLKMEGQTVQFDSLSFKILLLKDSLYADTRYSKRSVNNLHQVQYLHSAALIDYVTKKLESNSNQIMSELKKK